MAKGSVRKRGKKWYYRFYAENESGKLVQKEYVGTESKRETEQMLRKAMEEYEKSKFLERKENVLLREMLDIWVEEELKPGSLSNGTIMTYQAIIARIKQHPIGNRKLNSITSEHLQKFLDELAFGIGIAEGKPLSQSYLQQFSAVLRNAFRFAVFPKRFIRFNPMQYVVIRKRKEEVDLFEKESVKKISSPAISYRQYLDITKYLTETDNPALLPIQIAYFTGLRIGEVCSLVWQDINLQEQYIIVRRSMGYNATRHKIEIGPTKRKKIRTVDFCNTLAEILKKEKKEQQKRYAVGGEQYLRNYYMPVTEKGRTYYELDTFPSGEEIPDEYIPLALVCVRKDGSFEAPATVASICGSLAKRIPGLEGFHFHMLRHTYTSNLLSAGAAPKDVQELLGHKDVTTTLNIYAHASRENKRTSSRLLDQVSELL